MELFIILWFGVVIFILAKGIGQWIENENSPVLTVPATIVDMRRKTHHHHHRHGHSHSHSYHVTFEKAGGERIELRVKRYEYKEMAIGDRGMLTHQGTRYQGFVRTAQERNYHV